MATVIAVVAPLLLRSAPRRLLRRTRNLEQDFRRRFLICVIPAIHDGGVVPVDGHTAGFVVSLHRGGCRAVRVTSGPGSLLPPGVGGPLRTLEKRTATIIRPPRSAVSVTSTSSLRKRNGRGRSGDWLPVKQAERAGCSPSLL